MAEVLDSLESGKCTYCKNKVSQIESEWDDHDDEHHHYKITRCQGCGKKNWLKVCYHGSGHDCILTDKERSIDSVIKRVMEG